MATDQDQYYVRIRGKVAGPFSVAQLQKLKARGQFRRVHEVSVDGATWRPAGDLSTLFPAKAEKRNVAANSVAASRGEEAGYPVSESEPDTEPKSEWYYSIGDAQYGPVSLHELQQLAKFRKIGPDDMVWSPGMESWQPAKSDTRLFSNEEDVEKDESTSDAADIRIDTHRRQNTHTAEPSGTPQVSHILGFVVEGMHEWFSDQQLKSANVFFISAGKLVMYIAILAVSVYYIVLATRQDSLAKALDGAGLVVILFALQYAGVRLFQAMDSLVESTPTRVSTTAFADSIAIIFSAIAFVAVISGVYLAVQFEEIQIALVAICVFCALQYVAIVALNPSFLNVTTDAGASTGQEAIGVLSFLTMLWVRALPIAFTFNVAAMVTLWGIAVYRLLTSNAVKSVSAADVSYMARGILFVGAMPCIGYFLFISCYLAIDVLRSILALPSKLDALSPDKDSR